jgi:YHS domain-containing protein
MLRRQMLLLCGLVAAWGSAFADPAVYLDSRGYALSGHDPVAYFTDKKPVKGDEKFSESYSGAKYSFASEKNRDAFKADPAKYAPQYGGYCAYAASLGKKADGDPTQWSVVDGKLYINYNASVQKRWQANQAEFIKQADGKWAQLKDQ